MICVVLTFFSTRFLTHFSQYALRIVKMRIVGTTNIAKITKSMKMVSAAKLRGDQQRLAAAKPFAVRFFACSCGDLIFSYLQ